MAIIPLRFFPAGIDGGECKSIKFAGGASTFLVGPGAPVGGESGGVGALLLADAWEDGAEEPVSVGATDLEVPYALSDIVLLHCLLFLRSLLG